MLFDHKTLTTAVQNSPSQSRCMTLFYSYECHLPITAFAFPPC
jgi:hypothetical protein